MPLFLTPDENECNLPSDDYNDETPHICGENATCFNTEGSFYCQCALGFRSSSQRVNFTADSPEKCIDINECLENKDTCGPNAECNNILGSYSCICNEGFVSSTGVERFIFGQGVTCEGKMPKKTGDNTNYQKMCTVHPESISGIYRMSSCTKRNASSPQGPLTLSSTHAQLDSHWETAAGDTSYPGFVTVSLLSYKGLETSTNHSFSGLKAQEGHSFQINSKVVTATISNKDTSFLKEPVTFTFSHLKEVRSKSNYTCVYWDAESGEGTWSDRGCFLVKSNATHTVCSCYHLSSFAVLMALYEFKDTFQLQLITWVGLSLSLLCLFICILTFSLIRSIRSTRNTIHLHLCLSLFIANLVFLVGISRTESQSACAVVAGLLHFFFLAAFCWMCLEGVQLFRMVVLVFNTTFRPLYMMAGGYGVPAVIVAISALVNAKGYGTERHCWLNLEDGFIWSFFGPVCIIIMVNVFFFLITVWKLAQKFSSLNPDLDKLRKIKAFTITAVAQLCVLGTMWIFGCFQFEESTLAMSYLFTILNSLQGVLVFLMHCLLSKQVREEYGKILVSICALQKMKYSEFSSNQSSNSKSQVLTLTN
uniref:CD97 antigen-like n=1 Tax=Salmo trutta TaxID=8032 RepID=A0A674DMF9_SALTR